MNLASFSDHRWSQKKKKNKKKVEKTCKSHWNLSVKNSKPWTHTSIFMKLATTFYSKVKSVPHQVNSYLLLCRLIANISVVSLTNSEILTEAALAWLEDTTDYLQQFVWQTLSYRCSLSIQFPIIVSLNLIILQCVSKTLV